jgi:hypothetical protein
VRGRTCPLVPWSPVLNHYGWQKTSHSMLIQNACFLAETKFHLYESSI